MKMRYMLCRMQCSCSPLPKRILHLLQYCLVNKGCVDLQILRGSEADLKLLECAEISSIWS